MRLAPAPLDAMSVPTLAGQVGLGLGLGYP